MTHEEESRLVIKVADLEREQQILKNCLRMLTEVVESANDSIRFLRKTLDTMIASNEVKIQESTRKGKK